MSKNIKNVLINSPLRISLGKDENILFKEAIQNDLNDVLKDFEIIENKKSNPLKVIIVGEVKSGKSSLLNALLLKNISEVDVLESTSNIIEVKYESENCIEKKEKVTKVGVNIEYLKKINFVDTPGLKSITVENEQTTINYIQNSDVILFCIDATHLGQADVLEALEKLASYSKPIVGVVNKCDLLSDNFESIFEYIVDEYGLFIDDFFMISSFLELQNIIKENTLAKENDLVIYDNKVLKNNFIKLRDYLDDLSVSDIKMISDKSSINALIKKDIFHHTNYLQSLEEVLKKLDDYEKYLKEQSNYINKKMEYEMNNWSNKAYLDEKFFNMWQEVLNEDISLKNIYEKKRQINFIENDEKMKISILSGAVFGMTSATVASVYTSALGFNALHISLLSYCPPLIIAGGLSGAVATLIFDKNDEYEKVDDYFKLGEDIINLAKEIYKNSNEIYMEKYEIEKLKKDIEKYLNLLNEVCIL